MQENNVYADSWMKKREKIFHICGNCVKKFSKLNSL